MCFILFMKYTYDLIIRLFLCLISLDIFYLIFTPLTVYTSYFFLLPLEPSVVDGIKLVIQGQVFNITEACVAGFAYYLFFLLTMLTKDIQRIRFIIFGFGLIFLMNVLRIILLVYIYHFYGAEYFEMLHLLFWRFISGIYVALVWIFLVKRYKVKSIPIYDDLKYLYERSFFKKN